MGNNLTIGNNSVKELKSYMKKKITTMGIERHMLVITASSTTRSTSAYTS